MDIRRFDSYVDAFAFHVQLARAGVKSRMYKTDNRVWFVDWRPISIYY